jgi:hypothetical protein
MNANYYNAIMFIQLVEFNFAHGQPTCKALYLFSILQGQYTAQVKLVANVTNYYSRLQ